MAGTRLRYDLWYRHTDDRGNPIRERIRSVAKQGEELALSFDLVRLPVPPIASNPDSNDWDTILQIVSRLRGRLREDGRIELRVEASRRIGLELQGEELAGWGGFGGGTKIFRVAPGETITMLLPPPRGTQRVNLDQDGKREILINDKTAAETGAVRIEGDQLVMNYGEFLADHTDELILTVTIEP